MLTGLHNVFRTIRKHELAKRTPVRALSRFVTVQLASRLTGHQILCPFVNTTRLFCKAGLTGANGNYYYGLMEFRDMAFLLHYLRKDDLFVDCGANIGSYSILASGVVGARTIAFEPAPNAIEHFLDNVAVNRLQSLVSLRPICVGDHQGEAKFTSAKDTLNHIIDDGSYAISAINVKLSTLDCEIGDPPRLIKIDTEGFDAEVLSGAQNLLAADGPMALIIEFGTRIGKQTDLDAIKHLEASGFHLVDYDPFSRTLSKVSCERKLSNNFLFVRNEADAVKRLSTASPVNVANAVL